MSDLEVNIFDGEKIKGSTEVFAEIKVTKRLSQRHYLPVVSALVKTAILRDDDCECMDCTKSRQDILELEALINKMSMGLKKMTA